MIEIEHVSIAGAASSNARLDQKGQAAPYLLILMLPLLLLAGIVFNTGDLLDQKIEAQEATDAAGRAAGVWAARTLNFMSCMNVFQTKTFSIICVMEGAELAAAWIAGTLTVATVVSAALDIVYTVTCVSSCPVPFCWCCECGDWISCTFHCLPELTKKTVYWVKEYNSWRKRNDTWIPRLWCLMQTVSTAEQFVAKAMSAVIGLEVAGYYRRNRTGSNGGAAVISPLPPDYLKMIEARDATYIYGSIFGPKGPDSYGTVGSGLLCSGTEGYSPVNGEGVAWGGFEYFESIPRCFGPFSIYRALVYFLGGFCCDDFCILCPSTDGGLALTTFYYFACTEYKHWKNKDKLKDIKMYFLACTPTSENDKPRLWNVGCDPSSDKSWGGSQFVAFDYLVMGEQAVRAPKLMPNSKYGSYSMKSALDSTLVKDLGTFTFSQARVYNGTSTDLFTQDWRATLTPIDFGALRNVPGLGFIANAASYLMHH